MEPYIRPAAVEEYTPDYSVIVVWAACPAASEWRTICGGFSRSDGREARSGGFRTI